MVSGSLSRPPVSMCWPIASMAVGWHGLEPLDVVDISDPLIAASAAKRRVASITWRYDVRRAVYEQQIELGAL